MVLRKYIFELTRCLSSQDQLLSVAMNLYAKGLISEEVKDMVITGKDSNYAKAASLLSAVEKQVKTSNALAGFLEVLKTNEIGQPLIDQIIRDEKLHVNAVGFCPDGHIVRQNSLVRQGSSQDSGYDPTEYSPHPNQLDILLSALQEQPVRPRSSSYPSAQPGSTFPSTSPPTNSQQHLPPPAAQLTHLLDYPLGAPVTSTSQPQTLPPAAAQHTHPLVVEHHPHRAPITTASQPQNPSHIAVVSPQQSSAAVTQLTSTGSPHLHQPAAAPSIPPTSSSNLQLVCEVLNASTGAVITGSSQTTVYRDITIKKKRCSVPPYTPLCMRVQANQRSYIYIINIGSSGKITTLVPNEYEPRHLVDRGTTLEFPSREADYKFELDGQSGEEIIVLLAYPCETNQAERDCVKLRTREPLYRDITIKRKTEPPPTCDKELNCNAPLGFLEVHFTRS